MATVAGEVGVDPDAFAELEASFRGPLIRPGDPTYDEHRRVWNASIDRHPALIAKCAGVADVIDAVRFARETGLQAAVRGRRPQLPGATGPATAAPPSLR